MTLPEDVLLVDVVFVEVVLLWDISVDVVFVVVVAVLLETAEVVLVG